MNLFLDTHFNDIIVILFDENNKIVKKEIIQNKKQNSTYIMPTIEKVLEGKMPESVIVVNGPGSFTGVRLGVTIAKTFGWTLNIPVRVVSSLECLAVSINAKDKIVSFSDNNGYYVGYFDENNKIIKEYEYLNNSEYQNLLNTEKVYADIDIDYEKIISFAMGKNTINPHKVNPIYIKKIEVEK